MGADLMCRFSGTPGKPCSLPGCLDKRKQAALGRRRLTPAPKGRSAREAAFIAANPICKVPGCGKPSTCDHIGGRGLGGWRRDSADLRNLCWDHHDAAQRAKKEVKVSGEPIRKGHPR